MYLIFYLKVKVVYPLLGEVTFFELVDFSKLYFPADWHVAYDKLGNGCEVVFPVRLESKTKFSSSVYGKCLDGSIVLKPKIFTEMIYVSLVKARC